MNKSYFFFLFLFIIICIIYKYKFIFNNLYFIPKYIFIIISILYLIFPRYIKLLPDYIINKNLKKIVKNKKINTDLYIKKINNIQELDIIHKQKICKKQKYKCYDCKKIILDNDFLIKYKPIDKEINFLSNYFAFCDNCYLNIK